MAHCVRHLQPTWELARQESVKHRSYREASEKHRLEIDKTRSKTSGLWWEDQRNVDQVAPSHLVNPEYLDTFNYRYQVYARPQSVQNAPPSLVEAIKNRPIRYDVKRIAVDKVWVPGALVCSSHWSNNPWRLTCCPPIESDKIEKSYCDKNNTRSVGQVCHFDAVNHPHSSDEMFVNSKTTDPASSCNKGHSCRDMVADLLGNQNNNRSLDLARESEIILVDYLEVTDMDITGRGLKQKQDNDLVKVSNSNLAQIKSGLFITAPHSLRDGCGYWTCLNNNAECEYDSVCRTKCAEGHYCQSSCLPTAPNQDGMSLRIIPPKYTHRRTSCTEMLGHLQSYTNPKCSINQRPSDQRRGTNIGGSDIGYMTYKIIGGQQYRLPPPKDYLSNVKLPPHLEEYREFSRRCPYPTVGRLDRSDPANEMLLPKHMSMNTMRANRNPFMFTRNPRCYAFSPLFYEPRTSGELCWSLPSPMSRPQ